MRDDCFYFSPFSPLTRIVQEATDAGKCWRGGEIFVTVQFRSPKLYDAIHIFSYEIALSVLFACVILTFFIPESTYI